MTSSRSVLRLVYVGAISAITACSDARVENQAPAADSATVARANMAADSLGPALMGKLLGAMQAGGPDAAVSFCSDSAQALTARFAHNGVNIRRVGTRVRNPLNAPDTLERRVLAYFQTERAAGRALAPYTEVAQTGEGGVWELRVLRPITVLDRCTACHGTSEQISPTVRSRIAARYANDSAIGYSVGDLRGAISVRVPLVKSP